MTDFFNSLPGAEFIKLPIEQYFTLIATGERKSHLYGLTFTTWDCRVRGLARIPFIAITRAIYLILDAVLGKVLLKAKPNDPVRIRLYSRGLKHPIWIPPMPRSQLSVDRVMLHVEKVLQSNENFRIDQSFELFVQHAAIPNGGTDNNIPKLLRAKLDNKRCVTQVRNNDEICLARAIVIAKALADGDRALYTKLHHTNRPTTLSDRTAQTKKAKALIALTGLPIRAYSLDDVAVFQSVLPDYMILVVGITQLNSIIFSGPEKNKKIILLLHGGHYDVLTSLPAWFSRNHYCFTCHVGFDRRESHRCSITCKACLRQDCEDDRHSTISCSTCHRKFYGQECFDTHKRRPQGTTGKSICDKFFICQSCLRFVSLASRNKQSPIHRCGERYCTSCCLHVMPEMHVCYLKQEILTNKKLTEFKNTHFLYFDLETYTQNGRFIANYACIMNDAGEKWTFPADPADISEKDISTELCEFIFQEKHAGFIVIAHNLKGKYRTTVP